MRTRELAICGLKAVRSRFESDSNSVIRLFFNRATAPAVGDLCRWMAQERLVYRCVESDELERISGTLHHGGVVVIVEPPIYRSPEWSDIREWADQRQSLLVLDRVSNVHNLGAIIRSAAYFGVSKLILADHPQAALPTEATYRVAEGGLDHVEVYVVQNLVSFIRALRPYYHVMGAATHGGHPAMNAQQRLPCALVMGNEEEGLAQDVAESCTTLVSIPGSGQVESLNVSAAAAVLIWELTRSRWQAAARSPQDSPNR